MKTGKTDTSGNFDQFNTGGFELAIGNSTTRDGLNPDLGMIRYNTDINRPETYTNQGWKKMLIDSDLGTGSVEDAISAKLRAAKRMDTMTIMFQQGSGTAGAPRVSSGSGSQPEWITHVDNGPSYTETVNVGSRWWPVYETKTYRVVSSFYNDSSASRGNNYFFYNITPQSSALYTPVKTSRWRWDYSKILKDVYYGGEFTVDIHSMLQLPGSRWDYVYNVFGGVACISGMINRGYNIMNKTSWYNKHLVSPDLTDDKDTDLNYGKVALQMKYGCAGKWDHTAGFSFYFSGRKFKNF